MRILPQFLIFLVGAALCTAAPAPTRQANTNNSTTANTLPRPSEYPQAGGIYPIALVQMGEKPDIVALLDDRLWYYINESKPGKILFSEPIELTDTTGAPVRVEHATALGNRILMLQQSGVGAKLALITGNDVPQLQLLDQYTTISATSNEPALKADFDGNGTIDTITLLPNDDKQLHVFTGGSIPVVSADSFFQSIRQECQRNIQKSIEIGDIAESESETVNKAVETYLAAARKAYDAQMDFALYSLKPLHLQNPGLYISTLNLYRNMIQNFYQTEFLIIKKHTCLFESPRTPEVKSDTFAQAILTRGSKWDWYGRGMLCATEQSNEFKTALFQLKQQYLYALMAPEDDTNTNREILTESTSGVHLSNHEFISCTQLQNTPQDYQATRAAKFVVAEKAWMDYCSHATRLQAPVASMHGTGTGQFMRLLQMELMAIHEQFITHLMNGLYAEQN